MKIEGGYHFLKHADLNAKEVRTCRAVDGSMARHLCRLDSSTVVCHSDRVL
jgi:hypothetical protein